MVQAASALKRAESELVEKRKELEEIESKVKKLKKELESKRGDKDEWKESSDMIVGLLNAVAQGSIEQFLQRMESGESV